MFVCINSNDMLRSISPYNMEEFYQNFLTIKMILFLNTTYFLFRMKHYVTIYLFRQSMCYCKLILLLQLTLIGDDKGA